MTSSIRFNDLAAQLRPDLDRLAEALRSVAESGRFVGGPAVADFEAAFAREAGAAHAVGLSSGTAALRLALEAAGVGPGDEVVVPAMTFIATASAAVHLGARPIFADVLPDTLLMDPKAVRAAITPRTRAIVPVHLYGLPADMDELSAIAADHGLALIEDGSQAHGACYRGRPVGSLATVAGFSLYPTKNLGALGEAGVVTTTDPGLAEAVRLRREHCKAGDDHEDFGYNERLDTLQAAFLLIRLERLAEGMTRRRAIAARYRQLLAQTPARWQPVEPDRTHAYHLCVARFPDRDELRRRLAEARIETMVHYPLPVHLTRAGRKLGSRPGDCPVAERESRQLLSLPCHAALSDEEVDRVAGAITAHYGVPVSAPAERRVG